jgi:hypothetical protein
MILCYREKLVVVVQELAMYCRLLGCGLESWPMSGMLVIKHHSYPNHWLAQFSLPVTYVHKCGLKQYSIHFMCCNRQYTVLYIHHCSSISTWWMVPSSHLRVPNRMIYQQDEVTVYTGGGREGGACGVLFKLVFVLWLHHVVFHNTVDQISRHKILSHSAVVHAV